MLWGGTGQLSPSPVIALRVSLLYRMKQSWTFGWDVGGLTSAFFRRPGLPRSWVTLCVQRYGIFALVRHHPLPIHLNGMAIFLALHRRVAAAVFHNRHMPLRE